MSSSLNLHLGVKSDFIEYRYSWERLRRDLADEGVLFVQVGAFTVSNCTRSENHGTHRARTLGWLCRTDWEKQQKRKMAVDSPDNLDRTNDSSQLPAHGVWYVRIVSQEEPVTPNPLLGVFFHRMGGLAAGSFYVPYRAVRNWAWETYWLVGGFFSWIIVPWIVGLSMTKDLIPTLHQAPHSALAWTYCSGALWGLGGLTFGLTMRYLGMSLGMAMVLGYDAAFGTLMPPIFRGQFCSKVVGTPSGQVVLLGVAVCLVGIGVSGIAGTSKERELSSEQKRAVIKEFDLKPGMLVAAFSGVMSACFAYGLAAGDPIKEIAVGHGTDPLWQGLPVLVVLLLGGFTTTAIWCVILNVRNGTGHEYFSSSVSGATTVRGPRTQVKTAGGASSVEIASVIPEATDVQGKPRRVPMLSNYIFSALAGTTWYMQFFFYTMGETKMGVYKFSSWTLHMASIIIFSTLWGVALHEWRGASKRTIYLVVFSLFVLIASTVIVCYGNYLGIAPRHSSLVALTGL